MSGRLTPIASALPGRLRLRHPSLRRPSLHRKLTARLSSLEGLRVAEGNPAVGSLLVLYDPTIIAPADAEAQVTAAVSASMGSPISAETGETVRATASLKRRINRAAKVGMLGSMALSLAALGTSKRLHAGAGMLFVALMLVHTATHRKKLFQ